MQVVLDTEGTYHRPAKSPDAVKLIGIFDPHMSAHNPAVFKVDYWPVVKETIRTVFRFAEKEKVDAICWSGDLFHLKTASRNPLWFMAEVIDLFREGTRICPQLGIAGNHDLLFGSREKGWKGQPIELLHASGYYQLLDDNEATFTIPGFPAGRDREGVPQFQVRVAGASYLHAQAEPAKKKLKKGADRLVTLAHFWFGQQSGEFFGEPIYGPDYLDDSETDVYLIGHHHEDQGVVRSGEKWYDSHGSISRTGSHANDLTRRPAASLVTLSREGIDVKLLRPKVPPPEDLMDLERRKQVLEEKKEMETYIASLSSSSVESLDPKELLKTAEVSEEVRGKVLHYLEAAEAKQ